MENRGIKEMIIKDFDSRHAKIKELLTCPICRKLLREVTAIDECLHIFCLECIKKKIAEERLRSCPVCKVDLGVAPLQKLRADYRWQSIRNRIKFKRRALIKCGLIQGKGKKPQASEEAKKPEVFPLNSMPVRRKEKSISSVLSAEKASSNQSPTNGRRKSGGRKALPPRRVSLSSVPPIEETEHHHQTSSTPVNLNNGAQGRKQTSKPSKQELSNDNKEERAEVLEGMNALLKPLDCLVGGAGTSKPNMSDILQSAPSDAHGNKEKGDKGKSKEHTSNFGDQHNENESVSLPSESGRSRNLRHAQEKRPVVTEDLNVPAQVFLDAASSKCFRINQIWFTLVASDKQKTYFPLPPLPPCYLMVKDPNMPASFIRKYLVRKLRLQSEDEVELSLRGRPISPDCPLQNVVDLWLQTTARFEKKPGIVGSSGKDFVMVVTYGRRAHLPF